MRILFVASAYPSSDHDPRGIFVHRLARALVRAGVQMTVVAPGAPAGGSHYTLDAVDVHRATYWIPRWQHLATGLGGIVPNVRRRPWRVAQIPSLVGALIRKASALTGDVDLIHAHWLYPGGVAGRFASSRSNLPLLVTSHGGDLNLAARLRILGSLAGRVARKADHCIAVSSSLVDAFRSLGIPDERISMIPYGVDLDTERADELGSVALGKPFSAFDGFKVLYLGSLIPRKSVGTLLDAHARVRERGHRIMTAIVGSGPTKKDLRAYAESRRLEDVLFVDEQPPSLVPQWFRLADVLVLPSSSEGRPNVVLEALASGLPVVGTDVPGTRELIEEGRTGFLFPLGSAASLADRLEALIADPAMRERMGADAMRWVEAEGLSSDRIAQTHVYLYERILNR